MAKRPSRQHLDLEVRVKGPDIRDGRIPVPDLVVICQAAQGAVNRQAEAIQGRNNLRPGPKPESTLLECTLDLVSIDKGSAILGFEQSKPQRSLPQFPNLGERAIGGVADALKSLHRGTKPVTDVGVLTSLREMGELLQNGVSSVEWIVPAKPGRRKRVAVLNRKVQRTIVQNLRPPTKKPRVVEGIIEMADFKPADFKCRIHPAVGPSVICSFGHDLVEDVVRSLRHCVSVEGDALVSSQTGKIEAIEIRKITALDPLLIEAGSFFKGYSIDQLAEMQAVSPIRDSRVLQGGWPDDEDVDGVLDEIYRQRA